MIINCHVGAPQSLYLLLYFSNAGFHVRRCTDERVCFEEQNAYEDSLLKVYDIADSPAELSDITHSNENTITDKLLQAIHCECRHKQTERSAEVLGLGTRFSRYSGYQPLHKRGSIHKYCYNFLH